MHHLVYKMLEAPSITPFTEKRLLLTFPFAADVGVNCPFEFQLTFKLLAWASEAPSRLRFVVKLFLLYRLQLPSGCPEKCKFLL